MADPDWGGDNKNVDNQGNFSEENNFGFDPDPMPNMPQEQDYTYQDIERNESPDGQTTFDRDQERNDAAEHDATVANDDGGSTSEFGQGSFLNLDATTILEHRKMLLLEDPAFIEGEATGWNQLSIQLLASADKLQTDATALSNTWESDEAKEMFISRVGASTYSLREWAVFADNNFQANKTLYTAIKTAQDDMKPLYSSFQGWLEDAKTAETLMTGHGGTKVPEDKVGNVPARIKNAYFKEAGCGCWEVKDDPQGPVHAVIEKFSDDSRSGPMNTADTGFTNAYMKMDSGEQVWRGLQNAKSADMQRFMQITGGLPGMPGMPGTPGMPGAPGAPAMPSMPNMPNMSAMPAMPNMAAMLTGTFSPQALRQLQNLQSMSQQLGLQTQQLAAMQSALNAMQAKANAEQMARQLQGQTAAQDAAQRAAQEAALAKAQAQAAQAAAHAQQQVDTSGLQSALDRVQTNMPGMPGTPDVGTPMFGMPGFPGTGGMPGMPGIPGMSAPAAPAAGAPMVPPMGRAGGGRPAMPSLPGRNAAGTNTPKAFNTKVNIPGRGGGEGGMSPGARGGTPPGGGKGAKPTIAGRAAGTPQAPTAGAPGAPQRGMPRSLGGRNSDAVRRIVAARNQGAIKAFGPGSGVGQQSGLAGRGLSRPDKSENLSRARAAMRRSLQGRTSLDTEQSRRAAARSAAVMRAAREHSPYLQKQEEQAKEALAKIGLIDDHELFEVASAGNGIISRPGTQGPVKKAGPALGAS